MAKPPPLKNLDPLVAVAVADPGFTAREAGGDSALVDRLVSYPEMKGVWDGLERLARACDDEYLPLDVMTLLVALPRQWTRMSKVSTANARKNVKDIAEVARKLARMLKAHEADIWMMVGYGTDPHSLIVDSLRANGRSTTAKRVQKLDWRAINRGGAPAIPSHEVILTALADRLARGYGDQSSPIGGRPTKPNDPNAARTYYVHQLAAYLDDKADGRIEKVVLNRIVAAAVNVMVNDPNSFLDARHVALLLKS